MGNIQGALADLKKMASGEIFGRWGNLAAYITIKWELLLCLYLKSQERGIFLARIFCWGKFWLFVYVCALVWHTDKNQSYKLPMSPQKITTRSICNFIASLLSQWCSNNSTRWEKCSLFSKLSIIFLKIHIDKTFLRSVPTNFTSSVAGKYDSSN